MNLWTRAMAPDEQRAIVTAAEELLLAMAAEQRRRRMLAADAATESLLAALRRVIPSWPQTARQRAEARGLVVHEGGRGAGRE